MTISKFKLPSGDLRHALDRARQERVATVRNRGRTVYTIRPNQDHGVKQLAIFKLFVSDGERPPPSSFELLDDSYRKARGAPKILVLSCRHCGNDFAAYQKDGPGRLLRCYLDRFQPRAERHRAKDRYEAGKVLDCPTKSCGRTLGTPMVYKSESRPAYKLIRQAVDHREVKV